MNKTLKRNNSNKIFAGVCSGIADYFNINALYVRLLYVVICFLCQPAIIAYVICLFILPDEDNNYIYKTSNNTSNTQTNYEEINPDPEIDLDVEYTNFDNNEISIDIPIENGFEKSSKKKEQNPFELK